MAKPKIYKGTEPVRLDIVTLDAIRKALPEIKNGYGVRKYATIVTFLTIASRKLLSEEGFDKYLKEAK